MILLVLFDSSGRGTERRGKLTTSQHIIVVGCGLAGLTASIAFAKGGHQVTIVESAPCITYIGAGG
jgi:heterodisulfide reductase subunit A-like polyferredoxin